LGHKKERDIVFLVGSPRSGTTWLQEMLGTHPDINTATESYIFSDFLSTAIKRWRFGLEALENHDPVKANFGTIGLTAYLTQEEFIELMKHNIDFILSKTDPHENFDIFLEKTPRHSLFIDEIHYVLPNAKFIYIVRDPYDVTESLIAASNGWGSEWAPKGVKKAAKLWRNHNRAAYTSLNKIPDSHKIALTYEKLKKDPHRQVSRILEFLNLDHNEKTLETMITKTRALKKYGEAAKNNENIMIKPEGFVRKQKGKLTLFQKFIVFIKTRKERKLFGY